MELTNEFRVPLPVSDAWAVLTDVERIAPCMPGAQLQEVEGEEYRGVVKVKVGPITAQYKGKATFVERDEQAHRVVLRAEGRDTRGQGNANATITATLVEDGSGTTVTVITDLTVTGRVAQFGRGVMADVSAKLLGQFVDCLERDVLAGSAEGPAALGPAEREPASGPVSASSGPAEREPASGPVPASSEPATSGRAHSSNGSEGTSSNGAEGGAGAARSRTVAVATATPGADPASAPSGGVRRIDSPEVEPVDLLSTAGSPVVKRIAPIAALLLLVLIIRRRRRNRR